MLLYLSLAVELLTDRLACRGIQIPDTFSLVKILGYIPKIPDPADNDLSVTAHSWYLINRLFLIANIIFICSRYDEVRVVHRHLSTAPCTWSNTSEKSLFLFVLKVLKLAGYCLCSYRALLYLVVRIIVLKCPITTHIAYVLAMWVAIAL